MAHQHLGLAEIQALAGLGELFDTLVVFENYPADRRSLAASANGLRITSGSGHDGAHYPVCLMAVPGERLGLRLDYRPDLFDRAGAEALAGRLVRLLEAAVADLDRAIGSLDILAPDERRTILHVWNDTAQAIAPATVPELFAAQVARTPDAVAVVLGQQRLSYAELDARANQLAHHLRALGVGPEVGGRAVRRALVRDADRTARHPQGRRRLHAARSRPPAGAARLHAGRRRLAGDRHAIGAGCDRLPAVALASCGSMPTGRRRRVSRDALRRSRSIRTTPPTSSTRRAPPARRRGVCTLHRNVVSFIQSTSHASWSANETTIQIAPLAFDASTFEIWGALLSGAKLVLMPPRAVDLGRPAAAAADPPGLAAASHGVAVQRLDAR